jgi:hypothetical protein
MTHQRDGALRTQIRPARPFEAVGDLCVGENIPRARPYLKILGTRSMARLIMEDGEERTEGIFYSAIAYENLCQKPPKPPYPELCTRPISRPIVYPDTSRYKYLRHGPYSRRTDQILSTIVTPGCDC